MWQMGAKKRDTSCGHNSNAFSAEQYLQLIQVDRSFSWIPFRNICGTANTRISKFIFFCAIYYKGYDSEEYKKSHNRPGWELKYTLFIEMLRKRHKNKIHPTAAESKFVMSVGRHFNPPQPTARRFSKHFSLNALCAAAKIVSNSNFSKFFRTLQIPGDAQKRSSSHVEWETWNPGLMHIMPLQNYKLDNCEQSWSSSSSAQLCAWQKRC